MKLMPDHGADSRTESSSRIGLWDLTQETKNQDNDEAGKAREWAPVDRFTASNIGKRRSLMCWE